MELLEYLKKYSIPFEQKNKGLSVGGYLDLRGTQITALPDNLSVGDYLDLRGTQITALPDNLKNKEVVITNKSKWTIVLSKEEVKIGCKTKTVLDWEKFFAAKNFYSTDPKMYPAEYQEIVNDFESAKALHDKLFN